ncbi:hypothetical protein ACFO1B_44855 [Dactylosporangium siamense]|uniref:Uncharacterized protein n=1 Tax=Dactylosporangium siamense TaxID=685454 RepID=A0A919PW10_9ACTN|nr:hypothetical protein [Dactylosporangium siamense]GIG51292.1 hypothetical protein Dsi01nite_093330 [Dactylosporangium siamense]
MSIASQLTHFRGIAARRAIAMAVVGATTVAGLIATAGPAHASGETDHVLIDNGIIDLGLVLEPFTTQFLAPGAQIRWNANSTTRTYAPSVFGVFSLTNAARICGWIKIEAFRYNGTSLGSATTLAYCPTTNSKRFFPAEPALPPLNQADVHKVRVSAITQIYGSSVVQGSGDAYPYD